MVNAEWRQGAVDWGQGFAFPGGSSGRRELAGMMLVDTASVMSGKSWVIQTIILLHHLRCSGHGPAVAGVMQQAPQEGCGAAARKAEAGAARQAVAEQNRAEEQSSQLCQRQPCRQRQNRLSARSLMISEQPATASTSSVVEAAAAIEAASQEELGARSTSTGSMQRIDSCRRSLALAASRQGKGASSKGGSSSCLTTATTTTTTTPQPPLTADQASHLRRPHTAVNGCLGISIGSVLEDLVDAP
ncbi:hypothetical protein V8C86DRAFT_2542202 [Haematococcus lacustris]